MNLIQQRVMFDQSGRAFGIKRQDLHLVAKEVRGIKGKCGKEVVAIVSAYKLTFKLPDDINVYGMTAGQLIDIENKCIRNKEVDYPSLATEVTNE